MFVQRHPTLLDVTCESVGTPCWMMTVDQTDPACWSNVIQHCWMQHVDPLEHLVGTNMFAQRHPTVVGCNMWIRWNTLLNDGQSNGSNMFVRRHPTLLDATCGSVGTPCWSGQ